MTSALSPGARWRSRVLAVVAVALLASLPLPARAAPAAAAVEQQVLFRENTEGYACFRIPALARTTAGTLLAFAEGRRDTCGDAGDIDIVLRRSLDDGRTWEPLRVVAHGAGDTRGNPSPVVDAETGRVLLVSTFNAGRADADPCGPPCDRLPYLQVSDDDGVTWTAPRPLGDQLRPPGWDAWFATGPAHGIQLTRGAHAGRLVLSVNGETWEDGRVTANHAALALSDDGGATWRLGATDSWPLAEDGSYRQKPQEMALVERADGSIYVNAREDYGTDLGNRTHTVSSDGGESFDAPFRALPDLYAPVVQGSVVSLPGAAGEEPARFLFASPADPDRRRTMAVRSSWDEGATWEGVDRALQVTADWSGYSDMVVTADGAVGLLYEAGADHARQELRFARLTEQALGPRRGPDPTTPDAAPGAEPARVLGGAAADPGGGRFGGAVTFDGTDDAVRLPYRDSLPPGASDVTVSLWFRYEATSGLHPFVWLGGVGTQAPQVWVRGEPDDGRLRASITAQDGTTVTTAGVATADAYNDGAWHHLSLVRGGGRLTLTVDGRETVSTADVPGSVSRTTVFGVHLGQAVDSRSHLAGSLDEVRVFDRALTRAELTALREANARPATPAVLDLPLDEVTPPHGRATPPATRAVTAPFVGPSVTEAAPTQREPTAP